MLRRIAVGLSLAFAGCLQPNPGFLPEEEWTPPADVARADLPVARDAGLPDLAWSPVPDLPPPKPAPDLRSPDRPEAPPDASATPDTGPTCTADEQLFAGHCYRVIAGAPMTYSEARQACKAEGALPVSIGDAAEAAAVYALVPKNLQAIWIGLLRTGDGKKAFIWESGEPLIYTGWAPGEPNNSGNQENCCEIWGPAISNPTLAGGWNDDACSSLRGAVICERAP